ncbi:porin [Thermaurantiacus sp.]
MTDLNITLPLGAGAKLILGKQKETFAYEMVGDAANLASSERVLSPFFVSRNTGARLLAAIGTRKMATISVGVYNTAWDIQAAEQRGVDVTARGTVLLWDDPARHNFLHLGLSGRFVGSEGQLRYKGRPGSNVASNFVDTGRFDADGAFHTGLEAMLGLGPVQFAGEVVVAEVDSPATGDPRFDGWYLTASWVLTGEARPYDRNVGYARRVIPKGRWGAPEIALRYAKVDLDDAQVAGGSFDRVDVGLNWWATRRWKAGIVWGRVWLDRFGVEGRTDTLLTRIQWVY